MKLEIFAIFDSKAAAYMQPMFVLTKAMVIRDFTDAARGDNAIGKHPEDFTLFHLGTFDDSDGSFDMLSTPVSLGVAIEYMDVPLAAVEVN